MNIHDPSGFSAAPLYMARPRPSPSYLADQSSTQPSPVRDVRPRGAGSNEQGVSQPAKAKANCRPRGSGWSEVIAVPRPRKNVTHERPRPWSLDPSHEASALSRAIGRQFQWIAYLFQLAFWTRRRLSFHLRRFEGVGNFNEPHSCQHLFHEESLTICQSRRNRNSNQGHFGPSWPMLIHVDP